MWSWESRWFIKSQIQVRLRNISQVTHYIHVECLWFSDVSHGLNLQLLCVFILFSETRVDVKESVRGQDIFIIQTIPR